MKNVLDQSLHNAQVVDRLIMRLASNDSPNLCMLIEQLPLFFRVTAIESTHNDQGWLHIAEIYHEKASLRVKWTSSGKGNIGLNQLVSIRWKGQTISDNGAINISRLVTQNTPPHQFNILETIPRSWIKNLKLVERLMNITQKLPSHYMDLINGILWDAERLYEFVTGSTQLAESSPRLHAWQLTTYH